MRSMTGFGVGDAPLGAGRVVAEVRSVNHRFLEVRVRLPRELGDLSLFAEQVVRERLRRGRVELSIRTEGTLPSAGRIDKERARAAFRALAEVRDELAPGAELPLSLLAAVPDLFGAPSGPEHDAIRGASRAAVEAALVAMDRMCRAEGDALAADLGARLATLRGIRADLAERAAGAADALRRRISERVERLLADREITVAPERLEAEIVLHADRSDVTEELVRLASHMDQLEALLGACSEESLGRRLDFLLQEMVREANTLGSKAQDAGMSQEVVAMKVELERMREQVQNVE